MVQRLVVLLAALVVVLWGSTAVAAGAFEPVPLGRDGTLLQYFDARLQHVDPSYKNVARARSEVTEMTSWAALLRESPLFGIVTHGSSEEWGLNFLEADVARTTGRVKGYSVPKLGLPEVLAARASLLERTQRPAGTPGSLAPSALAGKPFMFMSCGSSDTAAAFARATTTPSFGWSQSIFPEKFGSVEQGLYHHQPVVWSGSDGKLTTTLITTLIKEEASLRDVLETGRFQIGHDELANLLRVGPYDPAKDRLNVSVFDEMELFLRYRKPTMETHVELSLVGDRVVGRPLPHSPPISPPARSIRK